MAIQVADNFQYLGQKPLDARVKYATVADMAAVAASILYDGIMAYVVATEKNYQWKSTNPVDQTLGKWREFESGSGGASDLDDLGDVEITDIADGDVLKYDATEEKWVNGEDVGGAGRAKSSAIAPVFDDTETYAAGDRVMYEDELYVFNTAHTGAWTAADADKTDVDSEMPDKLTSQQMQDIKDAFSGMNKGAPLRMMHYSTEEQVVGTWIDGKPVYQRVIQGTTISSSTINMTDIVSGGIPNADNARIIECYVTYTISNGTWNGPIPNSFGSTAMGSINITKDASKLYFGVLFNDYNNKPFTAIIQYTKTTD